MFIMTIAECQVSDEAAGCPLVQHTGRSESHQLGTSSHKHLLTVWPVSQGHLEQRPEIVAVWSISMQVSIGISTRRYGLLS